MILQPPSLRTDTIQSESPPAKMVVPRPKSRESSLKNKFENFDNVSVASFESKNNKQIKKKESSLCKIKCQKQDDEESVHSIASRGSQKQKIKESSLNKIKKQVYQDNDSVHSGASKNSQQKKIKQSSLSKLKKSNQQFKLNKEIQKSSASEQNETSFINYLANVQKQKLQLSFIQKHEIMSPRIVSYQPTIKRNSSVFLMASQKIINMDSQDEKQIIKVKVQDNNNKKEYNLQRQKLDGASRLSNNSSTFNAARKMDVFGRLRDNESVSRVSNQVSRLSTEQRRKSRNKLGDLFRQDKQKNSIQSSAEILMIGENDLLKSKDKRQSPKAPAKQKILENITFTPSLIYDNNSKKPMVAAKLVPIEPNMQDTFHFQDSVVDLNISQSRNMFFEKEQKGKESIAFAFQKDTKAKVGLTVTSGKRKQSAIKNADDDRILQKLKENEEFIRESGLINNQQKKQNPLFNREQLIKKVIAKPINNNQEKYANAKNINFQKTTNELNLKAQNQKRETKIIKEKQQQAIKKTQEKLLIENEKKRQQEIQLNAKKQKAQKLIQRKKQQQDKKLKQKRQMQIQQQLKEKYKAQKILQKKKQQQEQKQLQKRQMQIQQQLKKNEKIKNKHKLYKDQNQSFQSFEQQNRLNQLKHINKKFQSQQKQRCIQQKKQYLQSINQQKYIHKQYNRMMKRQNNHFSKQHIEQKIKSVDFQKSEKSQSGSQKSKKKIKQSTVNIPKKSTIKFNLNEGPYIEQSFYQNEQKCQLKHQNDALVSFDFEDERYKSKTDINFYDYSNSQKNLKVPSTKPPLSHKSNSSKAKQSSLNIKNESKGKEHRKISLLQKALAKKYDDGSDGSNSQASFKSCSSKKSSKKESSINKNKSNQSWTGSMKLQKRQVQQDMLYCTDNFHQSHYKNESNRSEMHQSYASKVQQPYKSNISILKEFLKPLENGPKYNFYEKAMSSQWNPDHIHANQIIGRKQKKLMPRLQKSRKKR